MLPLRLCVVAQRGCSAIRIVSSSVKDLLRMIDANANRAREGLRVMEDAARFVLDDAIIAERCKEARHGVSEAVALLGIDQARLLASRDTAGDVGVGIKVEGEQRRDNLASVLAANAGRVTEALRVLSEVAKVMGGEGVGADQRPTPLEGVAAAVVFERVRYDVYEIQRALTLALGAGDGKRLQPRVCVLVTESLCVHHSWREVARRAMLGGADMIQLREKELESRELLSRAKELVALCREHGAKCVINDRVDIAMLSGAWGVHVGQRDLSVFDVRAMAGTSLRVGVSTENIEQAIKACRDGADYCGVGPMFPTTTKDKPRLAGAAYLRSYVSHERIGSVPHLAIGGITPERMPELVAAGVKGVAVSSVVCRAREPGEVVGELKRAMGIESDATM